MAEDRIALSELVAKYADADLFRELGQYALQRLMEMEAGQIVGAGHHERTDERTTHRNGYRDLRLETPLGAVVQEAYVKGVSTRKVDDLVQALGMSGISESQVSKLCSELDERVESFLKRELTGPWPGGQSSSP